MTFGTFGGAFYFSGRGGRCMQKWWEVCALCFCLADDRPLWKTCFSSRRISNPRSDPSPLEDANPSLRQMVITCYAPFYHDLLWHFMAHLWKVWGLSMIAHCMPGEFSVLLQRQDHRSQGKHQNTRVIFLQEVQWFAMVYYVASWCFCSTTVVVLLVLEDRKRYKKQFCAYCSHAWYI